MLEKLTEQLENNKDNGKKVEAAYKMGLTMEKEGKWK